MVIPVTLQITKNAQFLKDTPVSIKLKSVKIESSSN